MATNMPAQIKSYSINPDPASQAQQGFIALMSALIIAVLLMAITLSLSLIGFFGRGNILDSEYKERSLALAEACGDMSMLRLANNPGYTGPETVTIDGDPCTIQSAMLSGGQYTVRTQAKFPGSAGNPAITNIKIVASGTDLSLISWEEVPN